MERFKIKHPDKENIIIQNLFIADEINPIVIKKVDKLVYCILFKAHQTSTDEDILITTNISINQRDMVFIKSLTIYDENIMLDEKMTELYMKALSIVKSPMDIYNSDFDSIERKDKPYFKTNAYRQVSGGIEWLELMLTRDNFIRLNLFLNRLSMYSNDLFNPFVNKIIYSNMEFITIDHIKHDASTTDIEADFVMNHYTMGRGPSIFKVNYLSPKISGKKLRNPMAASMYDTFYNKDYIIADMIYEPNSDILYLVYEEFSPLTGEFKKTKILRLSKEFYNRTNFIDNNKIYEN